MRGGRSTRSIGGCCDERVPAEENVFSLFELHTRWCAKGKAGVPVELGVPRSESECAQ